MTARVLFLGNSHLAALREAWTANPGRWPMIEASFLGAHRDHLLETRLDAGRLVAATPAAQAAFDRLGCGDGAEIATQDLIVLCGCLVAVASAALVWRDMRWDALPSLRSCPDLAAMSQPLVSRAAALACLRQSLSHRLGPLLAGHLRAEAVTAPIWLASQPRTSEVIARRPRPEARAQSEILRLDDAAEVAALFDSAAAAAMAQSGAGYLPQPPQTITRHILTALTFMQGAPRLAARPGRRQDADDILHGNAAYGAAVLDQIASRLRSAQDG